MENIFNNCSTLIPEKLKPLTVDFTNVVQSCFIPEAISFRYVFGLTLNGVRISPALVESLDLKVGDRIKATEVTPYNYGNGKEVYRITKCEKL